MRQPRPLRGTATDEPWLIIDHEVLRGVSFAGAKLLTFTAVGSRFDNCVFEGVSVDDAELAAGADRSEYTDCVFEGVRLGRIHAGVARFIRCSFRNVRLRNWRWGAVDLIDCTFSGVLRSSLISGRVPDEHRSAVGRDSTVISGNDFRRLTMPGVEFVGGVDLSRQRMPRSSAYLYLRDAASALSIAETALQGCPAELRDGVGLRLRRIRNLLDGGQRQVWITSKRFFGGRPDAARWLVGLWHAAGQLPDPPDEPAYGRPRSAVPMHLMS
ncbi:hypothetical protein [Micromonospora sp. NPDC049679]|uniref:hypothetical protein n=1 Tax=Micromonospora sp. NPDC049679 TaxID=3155920 RepID=UPI0033FA2D9B